MPLPDDYLAELEQRARQFSGAYTGTTGSLAAGCLLLLKELKSMRNDDDDIEPQCVAAMDPQRMEAIWSGIKAQHRELHQRIAGDEEANRQRCYAAPADSDTPPAEQVIKDALDAVRDRRRRYGPPGEHFARTVGMLNALFAHKLREPFTPRDWATIMQLDKLARDAHMPQHDNNVDSIGYTACRAEIDAASK
jgi:hypothetical protein